MAAVDLSVLITCYFEENSIEEFHRNLSKELKSIWWSYEIIFVNDGSKDNGCDKLKAIFAADGSAYAVVDLFRNSGQQSAIMDSDLQLLPEELPVLVTDYDPGYDLVAGSRVNRKDSLLGMIPSVLANVIMRRASPGHSRSSRNTT